MSNTNSWLCIYAIAQIGRPYWYATSGQISTLDLYTSTVLPALKRDNLNLYTNYNSQLNVKVHDCSGLVVGALTCKDVNGKPDGTTTVAHGATSQFNYDCSSKSNKMSNFPQIPGTLVFHSSGKTKTHVGIYVGTYVDKEGVEHKNVVVEAMNHANGVTTSSITNSKWDSWGQLSVCVIDTIKGMKFDARQNPTYATMGASIIQTKNMNPFVATIPEGKNPKIDYSKIKEARISAMMFYAGELYDVTHTKKKTYVSKYLNEQVNNCNNAGLPYALYVNVRARNEIEADAECRVLYYVVSRYSPMLGLWLSLNLSGLVAVNNKILEVYYKYIERWGLKSRCGLYVTPEQLKKITWGSFKDRFYLWQIDKMDVDLIDEELLQPEMFEVPD